MKRRQRTRRLERRRAHNVEQRRRLEAALEESRTKAMGLKESKQGARVEQEMLKRGYFIDGDGKWHRMPQLIPPVKAKT